MRILLTGATGNIGNQALRELLRQGHTVRCLVRDARRMQVTGPQSQLEVMVGDTRDPAQVKAAVVGQEMVIHLAALIPPASDLQPELAYATNVGGTKNVIAAIAAQPQPPKLVYMSTIALFGRTQDQPPPRRVGDPLAPLDPYSMHKVECEGLLRASSLTWVILRCTAVPRFDEGFDPVRLRAMFAIAPTDRMEMLHPADAGLAVANAAKSPDVWGKTLIIAGGSRCRMTMRDYYQGYFDALGIKALPAEAFSHESYHLDWYDTEESEALLQYQRHTFADFVAELRGRVRGQRLGVALAQPIVRWVLLRYSSAWKERRKQGRPKGYYKLSQ